jgi:hypothetical protein
MKKTTMLDYHSVYYIKGYYTIGLTQEIRRSPTNSRAFRSRNYRLVVLYKGHVIEGATVSTNRTDPITKKLARQELKRYIDDHKRHTKTIETYSFYK